MRTPFVFVLTLLHSMALCAIETRPFSVREFKTRDIKFRQIFDREETDERTRPSRGSQTADDRRERSNARRVQREREREIQAQIRENERQQRELQQAKERAEREEWKNYLEELRASNEQLRVAVEAKRERESHPESYCGAVLSDGSKCPNRVVDGKWFCVEHEDPPLPKSDLANIQAQEERPDTEGQTAEDAVEVEKSQPRHRKHKAKSLFKGNVKQHQEDDIMPSSSYWMIAVIVGCSIFFLCLVLAILKGSGSQSQGKYGRLSAQRRQQKK